MSDESETWVWADGTIYDAAIPGYRQATPDELRRNFTPVTASIPYSLLHTLRACLDGTADQPEWDAAKDELDELLLSEPDSPILSAATAFSEATACTCGNGYEAVCRGVAGCWWDGMRPA